MIQVNYNPLPHVEGMTIDDVLKEKKYMDHMIVVKINGNHVRPEEYKTKVVKDGDDVKVIHLFGGG